jgi:hypothetical protein
MPMTVLKHKQALYEIFTAAMEVGQPLDGYCEGVLKSSVKKVPAWNKFIVLAEFSCSDVAVGFMNKKFRVVSQLIMAVAPVRDISEGEEIAETTSFELSRKVRTILAGNKTLVSTSYPSGIAIESEHSDSEMYFVVIQDMICMVQASTLRMKVVEED